MEEEKDKNKKDGEEEYVTKISIKKVNPFVFFTYLISFCLVALIGLYLIYFGLRRIIIDPWFIVVERYIKVTEATERSVLSIKDSLNSIKETHNKIVPIFSKNINNHFIKLTKDFNLIKESISLNLSEIRNHVGNFKRLVSFSFNNMAKSNNKTSNYIGLFVNKTDINIEKLTNNLIKGFKSIDNTFIDLKEINKKEISIFNDNIKINLEKINNKISDSLKNIDEKITNLNNVFENDIEEIKTSFVKNTNNVGKFFNFLNKVCNIFTNPYVISVSTISIFSIFTYFIYKLN